jgi:hypothetical protein
VLKTPITDLVSRMFADGMPAASIIAAVRDIEIGKRGNLDADFDVFWQLYPNRVGKLVARKAYEKARKNVTADIILDGVRRYAAKADDRFWKNPSSWLNSGGWMDEAPQPIAAIKGLAGVRARLTQEIANDGYSARDQGNGLDHAGGVPQLEFFRH